MTKPILKLQAQTLRKKGFSLRDISLRLSISKSSASMWCRGIPLSKEQVQELLRLKDKNMARGRLRGALFQKMKKIKTIQRAEKEAKKLKSLRKKEFFIAGLALYLAEGSKRMGRVQFVNSDPKVINFMLKWFKHFYNITSADIRCTVLINQVHRSRDAEIKKFWQKYLKIKSKQFTDIRYIKAKQKKIYANHNNYFGTFSFRINKSSKLLYTLNAFSSRLLTLI